MPDWILLAGQWDAAAGIARILRRCVRWARPFASVRILALRSIGKSGHQGIRSCRVENAGHDTRAIQQHYLGHQNIQHAVRYIGLSVKRFKRFLGNQAFSLRQRSNGYANMLLLEQSGRILRTSRSETMKAMKWILAVVTTTMIMIPPQSANAWDGGHPGGHRGNYGHGYAGDYRGDYGPRYHGRGYGYHGPRYYGRGHGYYRRPWVGYRGPYHGYGGGCWGCGSAGAALAGLAIGTIVGAAIINSAPPPVVVTAPPPW